jgi:hypothetical protein
MIAIIYLLLYFSFYTGFSISIWYTYYFILFTNPIVALFLTYIKLNNYMINSNDPILSTFGIVLFSFETFLIYLFYKMKLYCLNNPNSFMNIIYDVLIDFINKIQYICFSVTKYLTNLTLEEMTLNQLKIFAKDKGLIEYNNLKKEELVQKIKHSGMSLNHSWNARGADLVLPVWLSGCLRWLAVWLAGWLAGWLID